VLNHVLRRSAVPLVGLSLVLIVVVVALVALDIDGPAGDSVSAPPIVQIGITSGAGQGPGTSTTRGQIDSTVSTSAVRPGSSTVVTSGIRLQAGPKYQGGSTGTTGAHGPGPTATPNR